MAESLMDQIELLKRERDDLRNAAFAVLDAEDLGKDHNEALGKLADVLTTIYEAA